MKTTPRFLALSAALITPALSVAIIWLPLMGQAEPSSTASLPKNVPAVSSKTIDALAKGTTIPALRVIVKAGDERTLKKVMVKKVDPDGILFRHEDGLTKVPFDNLTPDFRKKFGYDPKEAKSFAEAEKKREAEMLDAVAQAREAEARDRETVELARMGYWRTPAAENPNVRQAQVNAAGAGIAQPEEEKMLDPKAAIGMLARYSPESPEVVAAERLRDGPDKERERESARIKQMIQQENARTEQMIQQENARRKIEQLRQQQRESMEQDALERRLRALERAQRSGK